MHLIIDVPEDVAIQVFALPEANRRNISNAAAVVFAAALQSAILEREGRSEDSAQTTEALGDLVSKLKETFRTNLILTKDQPTIGEIIDEADRHYDAGERGMPIQEAFAGIRARLAER